MNLSRFWTQVALAFGFSLCCTTVRSDALDHWHWRNPLPTGNSLYGFAFGGNRFVTVGELGTVATSLDASNWDTATSVSTQRLNAVTYGNGLFVAVGEGGVIQTSPDGLNWSLRDSGTNVALNAVAYGNGRFVGVGEDGIVAVSNNGITWAPGPSGTNSILTGVAFGNGKFVAIGPNNVIFRSADGVAWTPESLTAGTVTVHHTITYANGRFLLGSSQLFIPWTNYIFISEDGSTWTSSPVGDIGVGGTVRFILFGSGLYLAVQADPGFSAHLLSSTNGSNWQSGPFPASRQNVGAYGNGLFVSVGDLGALYTSTDGFSWNPGVGQDHGFLSSLAEGNAVTVAVGGGYFIVSQTSVDFQPRGPTVLRSTNGSGFTRQTDGAPDPLLSCVYAAGAFHAVGVNGLILRSTNGVAWNQRASGTLKTLYSIAAGPQLLVAVGDAGTIQTSPNGGAWTSRSSGTGYALYGVAYGGTQYVAVGYQGVVITSPDGIAWTVQDSGTLAHLFAVAYGEAGFVAVGAGGALVSSVDGGVWVPGDSGTSTDLYGVSFGSGYYAAVGGHMLLSSTNLAAWSQRESGTSQPLFGVNFIDGRFLIVGDQGTILESDVIADQPALQVHRTAQGITLQISALAGSSFRLQGCTHLPVNSWSDLVAFTNVAATTWWNDTVTNSNFFYRAVSP